MKILVLGGAGYLGTQLTSSLVRENYDVTVFDKFLYSNETFIEPRAKIIRDDIKNINKYKSLINEFEIVLYLISPRLNELTHNYQVEESLKELEDTLLLVNENTHFIFFSSCSVYGQNNEEVDEDSRVQVTSLYTKLKIECERLIYSLKNPKHKILRLSTLYGANKLERKDLLINNLIDCYKNNKQIKIFDPEAYRPHLHVRDCSEIIINLISPHTINNIYDKVLNIGNESLNATKKNIVEIIEKYCNENPAQVKYIDSEDSRSYKVIFLRLKKYHNRKFISYDDGIKELMDDKKIICALEKYDSILDYYLPNGASPSWYLLEEKKMSIPKIYGFWTIFNTENNNNFFNKEYFRELITPNYGPNLIYLENEQIKDENYFYIINVWNAEFFELNYEIGFKVINQRYLLDVLKNKCKIILLHHFEGYSASSGRNRDLEIINKWIRDLNLPPDNIFYIHGNLLINQIANKRGYKFNCIPISIFESWISTGFLKLPTIEFQPKDNSNLFLCYNRRPRNHRVFFVSQLLKYDLISRGKISLGDFNINDDHFYNFKNLDEVIELKKITPLDIGKDLNINWAVDIDIEDHKSTFISIVSETFIGSEVQFLSEKIWKPIVMGHPFIYFGNSGILKYLHSLGFVTFSRWINESYDDENNFYIKTNLIIQELKKFENKTVEELKILRAEMLPVCEHNRNVFKNLLLNKYDYDGDNHIDIKKPIMDIYKQIKYGKNLNLL